MESIETKTENKKEEEKKRSSNPKPEDEYIKVTISKNAEKAITDLITRVNENYEGGRVNRQDLMSWVLTKFAEECTDQDIRAIRADHFNEIALLELCLKRSKQSGALPPELRKLLLMQAGLEDAARRVTKNKLTRNSINDGVTKEAG